MKWKDYWDCPEEIFVWACLQFPIYFIVGWWAIPIMILCGFLGRLGGVEGGVKWARWAVVPLIICTITFVMLHSWWIFLAAPFMEKISPFGYGKNSWLFKWLKKDFPVRLINFAWYWAVFAIAYSVR